MPSEAVSTMVPLNRWLLGLVRIFKSSVLGEVFLLPLLQFQKLCEILLSCSFSALNNSGLKAVVLTAAKLLRSVFLLKRVRLDSEIRSRTLDRKQALFKKNS